MFNQWKKICCQWCVYMFVCVYVCVCARARAQKGRTQCDWLRYYTCLSVYIISLRSRQFTSHHVLQYKRNLEIKWLFNITRFWRRFLTYSYSLLLLDFAHFLQIYKHRMTALRNQALLPSSGKKRLSFLTQFPRIAWSKGPNILTI
jgi:hypothetical protein